LQKSPQASSQSSFNSPSPHVEPPKITLSYSLIFSTFVFAKLNTSISTKTGLSFLKEVDILRVKYQTMLESKDLVQTFVDEEFKNEFWKIKNRHGRSAFYSLKYYLDLHDNGLRGHSWN
jgi:hypothetical protein